MTSIPSITSPSYIPTDDDILHVRIMTMGVVEHSFKVAIPAAPKGLSLPSPFKRKHDQTQASDDSTSLRGPGAAAAGAGRSGSPENGSAKYINMHIYDVGGARGQRHTWASFFEAATAVSSSYFLRMIRQHTNAYPPSSHRSSS
jgi:hypothetical protein